MNRIIVQKTMDYKKLVSLFVTAGLEIHPEDPAPSGLVCCFELLDKDTGELIGASGLVHENELFIIRCVAVQERYRGNHYGKYLVQMALEEAKSMHAKEAWLTAKIPEFYKKLGFEIVARNDAPHISDCQNCPQFQTTCHSEIMKIQL